jgi:hypothetical protein
MVGALARPEDAMKGKNGVRLTVAEDSHAPAVAEFFRRFWDETASADSVRRGRAFAAASNPAEPGTAPPSILALQGERVIGFLASIPARFWNGTAELPGYWLRGLMVLPEFRGGPIGYAVLREATRRMPRTAALTVAPAARRLFGALGYRDVGLVSNYVRVLRGGRVAARIDPGALGMERGPAFLRKLLPKAQRMGLASLGGIALAAVLRAGAARARAAAHGHEILNSNMAGRVDLDELWCAGRASLRAGAVRDGLEFDLRYGSGSGDESKRYRIANVWKNGRLAGVAVVRQPRANGDPRLAGIALATLSDAWFDPGNEAAGLATLGAAEQTARELGADAVLCSTGHPVLTNLLRRQGYLRGGGNMHLLFRDGDAETSWPIALEDWWVSRGDARSDEVF